MSRKGDKGGPFEGGEEGEGGAEGEGPDLSAPRPVLQQGAGMPGTTQGGPLSAGMMSHGNAHPNSGHPNSHTHPHGNVHGNAHHGNMGMHKLATGYTGNLSAGAGSDHSAVGSSMAGIKTEMKYSGSAHAIPNHLSQSHHQAQNHGGQHHQAHPLPSIPTMYTPGAASASGPHLNNLNRGNMTGMNGNHGAAHGHHQQGQAAGHGSQHGPVHSLLSQSQQQKLHQQQHMLHQQQNHQKQQQGVSQHQTSINPVNGSHNQHQHLQSGHVPISHAMSSHAAAHPAHPAHTQNGPAGQLHVGGQGTHQAARPSVPVVPTGLLLSGPSAAVLHSTAATSGAAQTIPSLPSVASHTASVSGGQNSSVAGAPNAGNPAFSSKK